MGTLHEDCGVFGVYSQEAYPVAETVYYGLFSLQHRGQEGCGITVNDDGVLNTYKDVGLVNGVFSPAVLSAFPQGRMAIGHVRYGTTGGGSRVNCQPIEVNHIKGAMSIAHNGNLTNAAHLRKKLELDGAIFHTTSDTEIIAYTITKQRLTSPSIEAAINAAMDQIEGAYSLVILSPTKLIAVRDKHGLRPLCYGQCPDGRYVVASESCGLNAVGAALIRDVEPGEIMVFSQEGIRSIRDHCQTAAPALCVFEYIYFARSDSVIDGASVQAARLRAGAFLAQDYPVEADVVIGVPDSGLEAALGFAQESRIPYGIGFVKNKYIARTFIEPGQAARENKVRIKLNPVEHTVRGKRVVLVDDSIVRGTTSRRIVKLLRDAGATEVHVRISAPPFLNPCYYGTDIDSRENLIACRHSTQEIAAIIGADSLGYLSVEHAQKIADNSIHTTFCTACFSGQYPTAVPTAPYKSKFEQKLSQRRQETD